MLFTEATILDLRRQLDVVTLENLLAAERGRFPIPLESQVLMQNVLDDKFGEQATIELVFASAHHDTAELDAD